MADLPPKVAAVGSTPSALQLDLPTTGISLENVEKELILKALEKCDWNQTHAAKYLDISRKTLIYRMEKHGLTRTIES
jgi:two-component system NtrC family response regulator